MLTRFINKGDGVYEVIGRNDVTGEYDVLVGTVVKLDKTWGANDPNGKIRGSHYSTRTEACDALVRAHEWRASGADDARSMAQKYVDSKA